MKYFTEPNGKFVIKIPVEWQYKNIAVGHEEKSPFSFELYENNVGAFQISCYPIDDIPVQPISHIQKFNQQKLDFVTARMDDDEFNMHLWYACVEDHFFIAKYIYDAGKENDLIIKNELRKVEAALSTLILVSEDKRILAVEYDRYEKFLASLAASFDLKNRALENQSLIELIIIVANQIDAYLRMSISLKRQLINNDNNIDVSLLYQGENDVPISERKIYKMAKDYHIINDKIFGELERLYKQRNKLVHRYIISEFKTAQLNTIANDYEIICEEVRLKLQEIENLQYSKGIGTHGRRPPGKEPKEEDFRMLYSQLNDKHLLDIFQRDI